MKRAFAVLSLIAVLGVPAYAGIAENIAAQAASGWAMLKSSVPGLKYQRLEARAVENSGPTAAGKQKYIELSGYVHLNGSTFVGQRASYAYVTVSGSTWLQDQEGRTLSGSIWLSSSDAYYVGGSFVNGWARPAAYVSIYDGGKYLGTIRIDGTVSVTGWNSNGWVNLNGSGYVRGGGYITDPTPDPKP